MRPTSASKTMSAAMRTAQPAPMAGGIALAGALAATSQAQSLGLGALTLAIVLGMMVGNSPLSGIAARGGAGVDFCKGPLLRAAVVLYGFRITFQQIAEVGWGGVAIALAILCLTFALAVQLGTRVFGLDRTTAILIGAGSSICGAAAVIATQPVVAGRPERVSVAVATVVVFGTLSMFAYPLLYPLLGLSEHAFGVFIGSTVHEVAQVVAAGRSIGEEAAASAVIEKMLRVMMLAPFLLALGWAEARGSEDRTADGQARIAIPWFALLFVAAAGVHSSGVLPASLVKALVALDTLLLGMAMAALGLCTHLAAFRRAGTAPLKLAASLFVFLVAGGYVINVTLGQLLAARA
ncbi:MAG: YeiH family protein [Burkholderiaceae bacterium]|nr:YeiH family protein [Burkholderiaceae bacterium]